MNAIPSPAITACLMVSLLLIAMPIFRRTLACSNNCSIKPRVPDARSIRNALDRMRPLQANRLVTDLDRMLTAEDIMSLEALDVLASRVFLNASNS
jgi:AAA lid domain-containing protein